MEWSCDGISAVVRVMPREGHGSRNNFDNTAITEGTVMPREGHGSRNSYVQSTLSPKGVMPREGHGSRNVLA